MYAMAQQRSTTLKDVANPAISEMKKPVFGGHLSEWLLCVSMQAVNGQILSGLPSLDYAPPGYSSGQKVIPPTPSRLVSRGRASTLRHLK